jgi:tetraprenyl-beta-curcumene synthase
MARIYKEIIPTVHKHLGYWKDRARNIPNMELSKQATMSICTKTFHCEGGSIYALLTHGDKEKVIQFVVAYQTISDYLDNLCDRSTSMDGNDFKALHQSMLDALTPGEPLKNYYRFRDDQNDGSYLHDLVVTCQEVLAEIESYPFIADKLKYLASLYCDLQVHKHIEHEKRVPALQEWFDSHKSSLPEMSWYEFSACSGSTLGIFYLVSFASGRVLTEQETENVMNSIFPWVQGLHILMDYFVDQEEDRNGGDLNFCFYYDDHEQLRKRFLHFLQNGHNNILELPDSEFHHMINCGLIGIYLADMKVQKQPEVRAIGKDLLTAAGPQAKFFYFNGRIYRKLRYMLKKMD